jgi:ligand-binding SRPBCC domain-containing protein
MKIRLHSIVNCSFETVSGDFGRELFEYLLPPGLIAKLIRYDGSKPGNIIHIQFNFPFPSHWVSIITDETKDNKKYVFVDEGKRLPFGLKKWKHIHSVIKRDDNTTEIIDDMNFETSSKILNFLAYPVLFLSFFSRKWQYKKYFSL